MRKTKTAPADMPFEDALAKLETIVNALEKGELSLDEALERFQQGVALSQMCLAKLSSAEQKIDCILQEQQGKITTKPLSMEEDR